MGDKFGCAEMCTNVRENVRKCVKKLRPTPFLALFGPFWALLGGFGGSVLGLKWLQKDQISVSKAFLLKKGSKMRVFRGVPKHPKMVKSTLIISVTGLQFAPRSWCSKPGVFPKLISVPDLQIGGGGVKIAFWTKKHTFCPQKHVKKTCTFACLHEKFISGAKHFRKDTKSLHQKMRNWETPKTVFLFLEICEQIWRSGWENRHHHTLLSNLPRKKITCQNSNTPQESVTITL